MNIAVLDFGSGNLRSVLNAFAHLGVQAKLTSNAEDLEAADALVLPGQGAFGDGMAGLNARGLTAPLRAQWQAKKPLLGICIGLQLFFEKSEEAPGVEGLGFLKGTVNAFSGDKFGAKGGLKVPQMGWNKLSFPNPHPVFSGLDALGEASVYFVHTFYVCPENPSDVLAESDYGIPFCAAAGRERMLGCQFHPEKSQKVGLQILRNFIEWAQ